MTLFSPVTEADLDRARADPAFRQKLLADSLEVLLANLKRNRAISPPNGESVRQIREGVTLAVRLAELIQTGADPSRAS
jgi:hypothetical protein